MEDYDIKITLTDKPKNKTNANELGFGKIFTDHMFVMDYSSEKGWHNPEIKPYGEFMIQPATAVFHYGQANFEGLKAYKRGDEIFLFRPHDNFYRLNISNYRMCIPKIDEKFCVEALKKLIQIERDWIPEAEGTALYIRPFIIAFDADLAVNPSNKYRFFIILSPVGAYYPEGINPVNIYVEKNYVRAVEGGVGFAKTAGNYAASLRSQIEAKEKGYAQVLWLDAREKKYIEEVGTMNVFFKIGDDVITPSIEGKSILSGITRDTVIKILKNWGINVVERRLSINEIEEANRRGTLSEVFGTGTAAVISPVGELLSDETPIIINNKRIGELTKKLYNTITGIQCGEQEDIFDWVLKVNNL